VVIAVKKYYGTVEISKLVNFHQTTVAKWIDQGKIPSFKTIGGHRKVFSSDLARFLRNNSIPMPAELENCCACIYVINTDQSLLGEIKSQLNKRFNDLRMEINSDEIGGLIEIGKVLPEILLFCLDSPTINGEIVLERLLENTHLKNTTILVTSNKTWQQLSPVLLKKMDRADYFKYPINFDRFEERVSANFE